ncbi:hypothetical protein G6F57_014478 [Rhizopus arrhizus]|nr:hypothetical protein G6F35_017532 [Rhizopus arrhizus]KAG1459596.1 hypothetical protein G6F57_014478 [Rhizopus arrhizus]
MPAQAGQRGGRAQHDAHAPAAADDAALFPVAEQPADGVQGGAGHLGDVLPRDGKADVDAVAGRQAGLVDQPQYRARHALFDVVVGEFLDALVRLLQTVPHRVQGGGGQLRMAGGEGGPGRGGPGQAHAFLHGLDRGGITGLPHGAG